MNAECPGYEWEIFRSCHTGISTRNRAFIRKKGKTPLADLIDKRGQKI
jgi:hypothetical protein